MKPLTKKLFYPLFLIFCSAILYFLLQTFPNAELEFIVSGCIGLTSLLCFLIEYKLPYRKSWLTPVQNDTRYDLLCTFVIFPAIVSLCKYLAKIFPEQYRVLDLSQMSTTVQFLICLLVGEFLFYWYHRISHTNAFLWKYHSVHHSVRRVYWMNAGTFSIVDLALNFSLYCFPLAFFKIDLSVIEYVIFFSAVTGLLEHTNIDFDAGILNYVFNSAQLHRWHHSIVIKESQTNYGKALSVWDLVFGSFYFPANKEVDVVGID